MNTSQTKTSNDAVAKKISETIRGLQFGTVTIKVHDSKIVLIEVTEKKRLDDLYQLEGGGGI